MLSLLSVDAASVPSDKMADVIQNSLFPLEEAPRQAVAGRSGSFVDNMRLPVHRWFRYSAGFSAEWVSEVLRDHSRRSSPRVFDPFAGSGTVVIEAERNGAEALGLEAHPFMTRIAKAKARWREDPGAFGDAAQRVVARAAGLVRPVYDPPELLRRCFPDDVLASLDSLRRSIQMEPQGDPSTDLCWLALGNRSAP